MADMAALKMRRCAHCGNSYHAHKSPSMLKMTYCGSLCERADLGFTIDSLLSIQRDPGWRARRDAEYQRLQPAAV